MIEINGDGNWKMKRTSESERWIKRECFNLRNS
jgi:hypothetical protein